MVFNQLSERIRNLANPLGIDALGFAEASPFTDYAMKRDAVEIMVQARTNLSEDVPAFHPTQDIGGSFTLYMEVDGIKEL